MLTANQLVKRFGRTLALDEVSFEARPAEIHAVLGQNGAGKTTLANVIAGLVRPDAGTVVISGRALKTGSPADALASGIAVVHQSPMLFERMTWEENLALGGFRSGARRLGPESVAEPAHAIADRLGFPLPPPAARIERRSMTERVRLEMLRALSFDPQVLILDEPTGLLAPSELGAFLDTLRRLRAEGRIVILVTHKLGEALAVADRITVLRNGRVVARTTSAETDAAALARLVIGDLPPAIEPASIPAHARREIALALEGVAVEADGARVLDIAALEVAAGEIVGVAGVDGNGQSEMVEVLAGVRKASAGRITVASSEAGRASALAVIPQNRDLDGLILAMTLWENLILSPALRHQASRRGWIDRKRARDLCRALIARFGIRAPGPGALAASLSGGNRQRLCVARALAGAPRVIVAHNVTRGLDLGAAADVNRRLREFAAHGGAVMLISSDLDELIAMSDRLAVISRGRIREVAPADRDPKRLGMLMAGVWRD